MKEGSLERKALDAIDELMNQVGDLVNVISGDIDVEAAETSITAEIDNVRETWQETAKILTRLRAKQTRSAKT